MQEGNWTDEFDEMHEALISISSNIDVLRQKIGTPSPAHRLFFQLEQLDAVLAMIDRVINTILHVLVCHKTEKEEDSDSPKWSGGKMLDQLGLEFTDMHFWYCFLPPHVYKKQTGNRVSRDHKKWWNTALPQNRRWFADQEAPIQRAVCMMVSHGDECAAERERILTRLRKSKVTFELDLFHMFQLSTA